MRELLRLLIVDDEQAEREGLSFLITQNRYPFSVRQAANGREALAMLAKDDYAMVLADVKMPIMDGISLSREIRRLYPDMLVVIISAYGDFEYTQQAIKSRVSDYLLKPVDVQEFRRTMDDALDQLGLRMEAGGLQEGAGGEAAPSSGDAGCEGATGRLVSQVMRLIDENYAQDIGLEWLAGQVFLSPNYLSGLFKRATGKSVIQWITMRRMERAREEIMRTNRKIVDIAQKVGYSNTSYFCLLFRKYYGVTANQLREEAEKHEA